MSTITGERVGDGHRVRAMAEACEYSYESQSPAYGVMRETYARTRRDQAKFNWLVETDNFGLGFFLLLAPLHHVSINTITTPSSGHLQFSSRRLWPSSR